MPKELFNKYTVITYRADGLQGGSGHFDFGEENLTSLQFFNLLKDILEDFCGTIMVEDEDGGIIRLFDYDCMFERRELYCSPLGYEYTTVKAAFFMYVGNRMNIRVLL